MKHTGAIAGGDVGQNVAIEPSAFDNIRSKILNTNNNLRDVEQMLEQAITRLSGPRPSEVEPVADRPESNSLLNGLFDIASDTDDQTSRLLRLASELLGLIR